MKSKFISAITAITLLIFSGAFFTSCNNTGTGSASKSEVDSLRNQISMLTAGNEMISKNLQTFDTLDYTVFTNQQWTRLHESHAKDIIVHCPMDIPPPELKNILKI